MAFPAAEMQDSLGRGEWALSAQSFCLVVLMPVGIAALQISFSSGRRGAKTGMDQRGEQAGY